MRCIEIILVTSNYAESSRLIETWDVLKWNKPILRSYLQNRLIETWDVLKSWNIAAAASQRID